MEKKVKWKIEAFYLYDSGAESLHRPAGKCRNRSYTQKGTAETFLDVNEEF